LARAKAIVLLLLAYPVQKPLADGRIFNGQHVNRRKKGHTLLLIPFIHTGVHISVLRAHLLVMFLQ
jgi:hypothetical protein